MIDTPRHPPTAEDMEDVEAHYQALLDAAVEAIIVINEKGIIETANRATEKIFGYRADEMLGQNVKLLMPDEYRQKHDQYLQNYLDTNEPKIIGIGREVQAERKDGSIFPIELSVGEVKLSNRRRRFVGLIRDITNRVQAEAEVRETQERLTHVMRVSALGEMASGIAHEVNQPLTAIVNYARAGNRLIEAGRSETEDLQVLLGKIAQQAQRAGNIIQGLRVFIKKQSSQHDRVDLKPVLEETLAIAKADVRMLDCPVIIHMEDAPMPVFADKVQIQQVVLNLILNALDAMEESDPRQLKINLERKDRHVELSVADRGSGISEAMQANLFNPFQTTKAAGMGMGLAISHTIIESHGGRIWFTNNPDGGSIFTFSIPAADES